MFCPKCKAEYIPGITVCADCDVPLVDKLPEEKELPPKPPYKQLKALFNTAEIAVIKSILDDAKIDYYFNAGI
jgi:predicted amidophosphoribosyltransferase